MTGINQNLMVHRISIFITIRVHLNPIESSKVLKHPMKQIPTTIVATNIF
jgi:hypothetical protein